jgi:hypothetical protein
MFVGARANTTTYSTSSNSILDAGAWLQAIAYTLRVIPVSNAVSNIFIGNDTQQQGFVFINLFNFQEDGDIRVFRVYNTVSMGANGSMILRTIEGTNNYINV